MASCAAGSGGAGGGPRRKESSMSRSACIASAGTMGLNPGPLVRRWPLAGLIALLVGGLVALGSSSAPRHAVSPAPASAWARLPLTARASVSRALGADDRSLGARPIPGGFTMASALHGLVARFGSGGPVVRVGGGRVGLALIGYGYGERLTPVAGARPRAAANKVSYAHRTLSEWYVNGPLGLEQGFTLRAPPAGVASGPLTLGIRLSGNLRPSLAHSG